MNNPQIPNPDQLEHISPRNDPRKNAARYEDPPAKEEVKPPVPTVVLGPNAVYLVDPGYWPEKAEEIKPPTEEEGEAPVLTSLEPNELPVWAQDTEVQFVGENFTQGGSVIIWNGSAEPTTFIDAQHLATIVKPSTVQVTPPVTVQAWVVTSGKESEKLDFTFIA